MKLNTDQYSCNILRNYLLSIFLVEILKLTYRPNFWQYSFLASRSLPLSSATIWRCITRQCLGIVFEVYLLTEFYTISLEANHWKNFGNISGGQLLAKFHARSSEFRYRVKSRRYLSMAETHRNSWNNSRANYIPFFMQCSWRIIADQVSGSTFGILSDIFERNLLNISQSIADWILSIFFRSQLRTSFWTILLEDDYWPSFRRNLQNYKQYFWSEFTN